MWSLPETLMVLLGGFLAAWGMSLVVRARAARRIRRRRCADCNHPLDPAAEPPSNTCPRCDSNLSLHPAAARTRPALWTIPGLLIILAGLSCPWWSLPLLGTIVTGAPRPAGPSFGILAATAIILADLSLMLLVSGLWGDPSIGRPRCRRCWYPIAAALPSTCPECGRTATTDHHLYRTRRRRVPILIGLLLLTLAQVGWFDPYIRRHGLVSVMPTEALISGIGIVPDDWIVAPPPRSGLIPLGADSTLTGRMVSQRLTADQLKRVRSVAADRVGASRSIASMRANLELVELAGIVPPMPPSGPPPLAASRRAITPPWAPALSLQNRVHLTTRPTSTPELDAAYADALDVILRALDADDQQAAVAADWLLAEMARIVVYEGRQRLISTRFIAALDARDAELRTLAASPGHNTSAVAHLLRAVSGSAGPQDVPRLEALLDAPDPLAVDAAEAALGALAIDHEDARRLWRERTPLAPEPTPGTRIAEDPLTAQPAAGNRPSPLDARIAFTLGAGWRAWITPDTSAVPLLSLNAGSDSTWHHWAYLRAIALAEPAFLAAVVDHALANPGDTKAIALFNGLGDARLAQLDRWTLLLRAEHAAAVQDSVLELLYIAMTRTGIPLAHHRPRVAEYAAALERHIAADPRSVAEFHRYNLLARARTVLDWIDNPRVAGPRP